MSTETKFRTVYALMVAIDDYPISHHRLNGCVNDRNAFQEYLQVRFAKEKNVKLSLLKLSDKEATRQGIIDAFSHFDEAKDGDICLFYYSGHGSRAATPREFWHEEPDHLSESIVCWDSRLKTGMDLMDKELSYLIWKANEGKKLHFTAVFDCCHAGSNTRGENYRTRMAEPSHVPLKVEDYLGFEDYLEIQDNGVVHYTPPRGKHIHLAAAKSDETAKELSINGKPRGIFTYNLVELLEQSSNYMTYFELVNRLKVRIGNRVKGQTPQLSATESADGKKLFLNGAIPPNDPSYLVSFDKKSNAWMINAGSIQGIRPSDTSSKTILELENGTEIEVTEVFPNRAKVKGLEGSDPKGEFKAIIKSMAMPKIPVAIAIDGDSQGKKILGEALKNSRQLYSKIVDDLKAAQYLIQVKDQTYMLTTPEEQRPLFKRIHGYSKASAIDFLEKVDTVCHWRTLLELSNPNTSIKDDEIEVELQQLQGAGDDNDDKKEAKTEDWKTPTVFRYDLVEDEWKPPALRLKIKNTSKRAFWISALYLENNFAITNNFLAKAELKSGEEVWMSEKVDQFEYKTLLLELPDELYNAGITEVTEHIKIIISTDEVSTGHFNQDGLEYDLETTGTKRVGRAKKSIQKPDWTTKEIELRIVRPKVSLELKENEAVHLLSGLSIEVPEGVQGIATLAGMNDTKRVIREHERSTKTRSTFVAPDILMSNEYMEVVQFSDGTRSTEGLSVLELHKVEGMEKVNADAPVKIHYADAKEETIIPIGYDVETGLYYPLGNTDENGTILIEILPVPGPGSTRSLGGSIKILFCKILQKIGYPYQHPQLSIADFKGEEFSYVTKADKVKEAVSKADKIALFIHGIIGDTSESVKAVKKVKAANDMLMANQYDLVLTFDYENLHTEIQETARNLKEKLIEAGLEEGHGKTLHIYAHSMGGLVSRWMIEKEGGKEIVSELIQLGTPNLGTPWTSVYEIASFLLARAVNGATFLQPYVGVLSVIGKYMDKMFTTLKQMHEKKSEFLKLLNDGTDPGIPYTFITGNTELINVQFDERHKTLFKKILARFKQRGHFALLDIMSFKNANDIAVAVDSINGIPGKENWQFTPKEIEVACDHLSYFADPEGLKGMKEVVFGEKKKT